MSTAVAQDTTRLVVDSVGQANAGIVGVLRQIVDLPSTEIAKRVYQAPAELPARIGADQAEDIVPLLQNAGLHLRLVEPDAEFEPGAAEYEISLCIEDVSAIPRLIPELAALLGCEEPEARRLLLSTPAVILGSVSEATVAAMRERFADFPVQLDVSKTAEASFYVVVSTDSETLLASVQEVARRQAPRGAIARGPGMLTVSDLDHATTMGLWEALNRTGARTTICNLDFEHYDVRLDHLPNTTEAASMLEDFGIPARFVPRVMRSLPIVVRQNLRHAEAMAAIESLAQAGGEAQAMPYSSNRFALRIEQVQDPRAASSLLESLAELNPAAAELAVTRELGKSVGNLTKTTALWLAHELAAVGCKATLEQL